MTGYKALEIVKARPWVRGTGLKPSRVVLLKKKNRDGTIREYTTHIECDNGGIQEFYHGHYFQTLAVAKKDFETRRAV